MPKYLIKQQIKFEYSIDVDADDGAAAIRYAKETFDLDQWNEDEVHAWEAEAELIETAADTDLANSAVRGNAAD